MKRLLLALGFTLLCVTPSHAQVEVHVLPQPDGSMIVIFPAETVKHCMDSGGCRVVTAAELESFAAEVTRKACTGRQGT